MFVFFHRTHGVVLVYIIPSGLGGGGGGDDVKIVQIKFNVTRLIYLQSLPLTANFIITEHSEKFCLLSTIVVYNLITRFKVKTYYWIHIYIYIFIFFVAFPVYLLGFFFLFVFCFFVFFFFSVKVLLLLSRRRLSEYLRAPGYSGRGTGDG